MLSSRGLSATKPDPLENELPELKRQVSALSVCVAFLLNPTGCGFGNDYVVEAFERLNPELD